MSEQVVTLSELSLDLPEPAAGWAAEMAARGVEVVSFSPSTLRSRSWQPATGRRSRSG
jgi:hypothetical protein